MTTLSSSDSLWLSSKGEQGTEAKTGPSLRPRSPTVVATCKETTETRSTLIPSQGGPAKAQVCLLVAGHPHPQGLVKVCPSCGSRSQWILGTGMAVGLSAHLSQCQQELAGRFRSNCSAIPCCTMGTEGGTRIRAGDELIAYPFQ